VNTTEIMRYFEMVIDESDNTFVNAADKALFLTLGHNEFRTIAFEETPLDMVSSVDYTLAGVRTIDLSTLVPDDAGSVLLSNSITTSTRTMLKLHSVAMMSGTDVSYYYDLVVDNTNITDYPYPILATPIAWLRASTLRFATDQTGTIRVSYLKESDVNFAGVDLFVDNFPQFHPLIAMFAAKHYSVIDNGVNEQLEAKTASFTQEMKSFLASTRVPRGAQWVQE
tara:strand:- start:7368 stop:8042 length:675 start_codon:yes stop_codon:yes gene_type:complete